MELSQQTLTETRQQLFGLFISKTLHYLLVSIVGCELGACSCQTFNICSCVSMLACMYIRFNCVWSAKADFTHGLVQTLPGAGAPDIPKYTPSCAHETVALTCMCMSVQAAHFLILQNPINELLGPVIGQVPNPVNECIICCCCCCSASQGHHAALH